MSEREPSGSPDSGPPPVEADRLSRFKEFGPTSFAVEHRTSVVILFLLIFFGGILAYRSIPKESRPEIEIPMIAVNTVYPGVAPADIESLITRPLEDELNTISDLKELTSTSVEGYSSIVAEFELSMDMNEALQRVREKVDLARSELPQEADDPTIVEFNVAEFPIMRVNLSGEYGLVRLKEIGEELQDRLEQIPTVLRVDLRGGLEREVRVDVDLGRLQYYDLALTDIIDAIRDENVNIPGGGIDVGTRSYLVRVDGEFVDPAVIGELVVQTRRGRPIYVRDLAEVDFGFADRRSYARLDGSPVVTMDVVKRSGENIIETAEEVRGVIREMEPLFPPTTVVKITGDESEDIHSMVSSLENNIIAGLLLIVAVLFFFLGLRTSLFVAISIPTSMLLSFLVLKVLGVTMNMVVLFSLILALGMLVDNAIVVVENIYRYMEEGWDRTLAALKGTGEVAVPVVAATLTTLGAFAPLLFWPGLVGEFMSYLPLTLIVTLSSSLFVALVVIPTLCALFMRVETSERRTMTREAKWAALGGTGLGLLLIAWANPLTAGLLVATAALLWTLHHFVLERLGRLFQERWLPAMVRRYEVGLRWALDHRLVVLGGSFAFLVATIAAFAASGHTVEYFPEDIPPSQVVVNVDAPIGSRVEFTDQVVRRLEEELGGLPGSQDRESVVATAGGGGGGSGGSNTGRIAVSFVDYEERRHDVFDLLATYQAELGTRIAGAEVSVDKPQDGPQQGPPLSVELVGEDAAVLHRLSDRALEIIRNAPVIERLTGLESDMDDARPELAVHVDRERAAIYGVSTRDVGTAVRGAIQGIEAAKYRTGNDEFDIVVRLAERYRDQLGALEEMTVSADGGRQIPLLSVARWDVGEGAGSIQRKDMDRVATLTADIRAGHNSNAVLAEVRETLRPLQDELPPGYTLRFAGQSEDQADAMAFLSSAFLVALALIGFILVSQFNSVVKPVIILSSVIMSTAGVLLGLMLFDMPFVIIMTGVGIISLAGIVVNNAIVLIDYIDILRTRDAMDRRQALVEGGKTRFRPVVLTAITTALGLVPLAIGLNFDFFGLYGSLSPELFWGGEQAAWWGPMAVAVIAGILFATFLTLVLVPVMYSLVDDLGDFFRRRFTRGAGEGEADADGSEAGPGAAAPDHPTPERDPERDPEPAGALRRERLRSATS